MTTAKTGLGHQVKADLKLISCIKSSLEKNRVELGNNPHFAALAAKLDAAIEEAHGLAYSIDEALALNN